MWLRTCESSFEETPKPTSEQSVQRYEHFELVMGEDVREVGKLYNSKTGY